jgi:hypothetical protein
MKYLLTILFILFFGIINIQAATYTVTNGNDSSAGKMRQAITNVNADVDADQIVFDPSIFASAQTINLTSGELVISQSVTISGTGTRLLTVRRSAIATTKFRIFNITGGTVNISGITIAGGNVSGGVGINGIGSGVLNYGSTLTLNAVAVSGNTGTNGSGIFINDSTTIFNSTVNGNSAANFGGGIFINSGTVNIVNSTSAATLRG